MDSLLTEIAEGLVIRPGDTLIIRVRPGISAADAEAMRQKIEEYLPGVEFVIVAAEQLAVGRPGVADGV